MSSIIIGEEGIDVQEATFREQVLNAGQPSVSIVQRIQMEVSSGAAGPGTAQQAHGRNYIPQLIAFTTSVGSTVIGGAYMQVPNNWLDGNDVLAGINTETFECEADDTNIYISAVSSTEWFDGFSWQTTYFENDYVFDILILMEEALTS